MLIQLGSWLALQKKLLKISSKFQQQYLRFCSTILLMAWRICSEITLHMLDHVVINQSNICAHQLHN